MIEKDHYKASLEYWRRWEAEKQALSKRNLINGCFIAVGLFAMPFVILFALIAMTGKAHAQNQINQGLNPGVAIPAASTVYVDQIGNYNTINIEQKDTVGHSATVTMGKLSDVDHTTVSILQQGTGTKTASVEIKAGTYNNAVINQDGAGNHLASIQNLNGSNNGITVTQSGAGQHEFNVIGGAGTTNSNNSITATQSGGIGAEKWFNVWLNGANGATVNVQQTDNNPGQASFNIQCQTGCGAWSYIRQ